MDRRGLFRLLGAALAARLPLPARKEERRGRAKVLLVTIGGVRRQESFSNDGLEYIPHLFGDLLPQALFYPYAVNDGVTSHFNSIATLLTGAWQHLDDWGAEPPPEPTLLDRLRRAGREAWVVTSNKQLSSNIGRGGNVVLAKQLLIEAVERIILGASPRARLEREQLLAELGSALDSDYERLGWRLPAQTARLAPEIHQTIMSGLAQFIHGPEAPASGDELTYFVACEVMRRLAPEFLVVNFSDVEVAHNGCYSLHLAGIRRCDRLCWRLWRFLESSPEHQGRTAMLIVPEFGRDPDGTSTNGFFNHRSNTESCRLTWVMVLGPAGRKHQVVERTIRHIDVAPSIAAMLGVGGDRSAGRALAEFRV